MKTSENSEIYIQQKNGKMKNEDFREHLNTYSEKKQ